MGKFNKKLVADIKKEKEQEKQQRRLRVKYEVPEDVMIIEKDNTIKFFIRTTGNIVKLITGIIIFLLTVIGVSALIFPVSRMELFNQLMNTWNELKDFVEKDDFLPMDGEKNSSVVLTDGDFLICYPSDGHRTAVQVQEPEAIKKAIFKVKI